MVMHWNKAQLKLIGISEETKNPPSLDKILESSSTQGLRQAAMQVFTTSLNLQITAHSDQTICKDYVGDFFVPFVSVCFFCFHNYFVIIYLLDIVLCEKWKSRVNKHLSLE